MLTQRQKNILYHVVGSYINYGAPIGSKFIRNNTDINVSPASIRNDMHMLTKKGFLKQPHASAGRVPTDKGYRFFVDKILDDDLQAPSYFGGFKIFKNIDQGNTEDILQKITKDVSQELDSFVSNFVPVFNRFYKFGFGSLINNLYSELDDAGKEVDRASELLNNFDDYFMNFKKDPHLNVLIGKDLTFKNVNCLSMITINYNMKGVSGAFALIGPKRMDYNKNINILTEAARQLNQLK